MTLSSFHSTPYTLLFQIFFAYILLFLAMLYTHDQCVLTVQYCKADINNAEVICTFSTQASFMQLVKIEFKVRVKFAYP